jgi:hypothetical protein
MSVSTEDPGVRPNRRRVLLALPTLAFGLAGCVSGGGSPDLTVENGATETLPVSVTVTSLASETRLVEETVTLDPGLDREWPDVVDDERVRVAVGVRDGPSGTTKFTDGESDAGGLAVRVEPDEVRFSPFVA